MVIEGKLEDAVKLRIAVVLSLVTFTGQVDCREMEFAFLHFMVCTIPLDGFEDDLGFVCHR